MRSQVDRLKHLVDSAKATRSEVESLKKNLKLTITYVFVEQYHGLKNKVCSHLKTQPEVGGKTSGDFCFAHFAYL